MTTSVGPADHAGYDGTASYATVGQGAYAAGQMFEATGDIRALDAAVTIADNFLAVRNNNETGRVRSPTLRAI